MGTYAISGDAEVDVTVGSSTYRAYALTYTGGGNSIDARAFADSPGDSPVVVTGRFHDIGLRFRFDPGVDVGDTVSISADVGDTDIDVSAQVTGTDIGVDASGIADFGFTARVNPSGS